MIYALDGQNYIIRLDRNEQLSVALHQFTGETGVKGGWMSGLGGALEVTLGYYNLDAKQYQWQEFKGLREITGMQGNLALDESGSVRFHLHGTFADDQFRVIGGHIKDLIAGATVELFIYHSQPLHRATDKAVGLQTLQLKK